MKAVDWLLFNYPEFVVHAKTTDNEQRGMTEFLPRVNRPKSPIERVVISRGFMQEVAQQIEVAVRALDEYQQQIVFVKYGWHWEGDRVVLTPPMRTTDTYAVLVERGFHWSKEKFYDELRAVREIVKKYMHALSRTTLREVSNMMPRRRVKRRVTDEQFETIVGYIQRIDSKKT